MNDEIHISGGVSAIVMLAAIASTFSVYSIYKDEQVAMQYEETQSSLEQTASALVSLRLAGNAVIEEPTMTGEEEATAEIEVNPEL